MSVLCARDERLKIGFEKLTDPDAQKKFLRDYQDEILLQAIKFDQNERDSKAKRLILDWLFANGQLEIRFAYPKEKPPERVNIKYHKKMGYFQFSDDEFVAFKGSWNDTLLGGGINGEECDVYSSEREGDLSRCKRTIQKVDDDWDNKNKKFLNIPISKKILKAIQDRAPRSVQEILDEFPDLYDLFTSPEPESDLIDNDAGDEIPNEGDLRGYQIDVIEDWEKNNRSGLVEHATGTGKTWTGIFSLKDIY